MKYIKSEIKINTEILTKKSIEIPKKSKKKITLILDLDETLTTCTNNKKADF